MFLKKRFLDAVPLAAAISALGWMTAPALAAPERSRPNVTAHTNQDGVPDTHDRPTTPSDGAFHPGGAPRWGDILVGKTSLDPDDGVFGDEAGATWGGSSARFGLPAPPVTASPPRIGDMIVPSAGDVSMPELLGSSMEIVATESPVGVGSPIPGPGALGLLGLGGAVLLGHRRRRRA